ncbi:cobalamin biosynthesis protein [Pseudooceanicola sediminis]|uniref:Cobalamin biosynthesis protein CobD n=1 Tax=Pseudooceanicola sediminis TaxID=2211117 RepID=A0A399J725_9RHOB|nr:adenosylcobinamide-phosphate synthase CbiB [Pseudooceanicola sediminis]KAA2313589.1 cobalamin biosynthesis protein [Puniceibacterium sp. HSS470]RII38566.1 cobalamin biosynthesis protein [Pseudooceanicola sediminis]|tara:strand:- start:43232 stop:44140 length:909 start_codon:yes stop_codon:yes gene_type:complete
MSHAAILTLALLLDALLGEPRWIWSRLPHPAVLMGRLIGWADRQMNHGTQRRLRGLALTALLVVIGWFLGTAIAALGWLPQLLVAAILLAQRSLVQHVAAVARALRISLPEGRRSVAMIVGRDTAGMDGPAVARAAIESAAENASDGVIAPAFWFLVAGLPGLLIYKLINTADSMIGYRTPRYERFGWAAARTDDLLNLIPARLSALALAALSGHLGQWRAIVAEANRHRSPNAGWPEAAMARALDVALSGPRAYDGQMRDYPFVHPTGRRHAGAADIEAACTRLWQLWACLLGVCLLIWVL